MARRGSSQEKKTPPEDVPQTTAGEEPGLAAAYERIADALPADEVARILEQRTRALAQVPPAEETGERAQVITLALGEETYAIETAFVEVIQPLGGLTRVPCTPDFVAGVINLRGRILSVIDLHRFMGLDKTAIDEQAQVVAVNAAGLEVALLVNSVREVTALRLEQLTAVLPDAHTAVDYTRGVMPDMTVFLDLEAIMKDSRMVVWEEV